MSSRTHTSGNLTMKTLSAAIAAAALLFAGTASATTRSADSLPAAGVKLAPVDGLSRKGTRAGQAEEFVGIPIGILIIGGAVLTAAILELAGAIDIFDDSPDSP
jgi:hypothetical protein